MLNLQQKLALTTSFSVIIAAGGFNLAAKYGELSLLLAIIGVSFAVIVLFFSHFLMFYWGLREEKGTLRVKF